MPFGWRWPLRPRGAPVAREVELAPVAPARAHAAPFEPDAGMMAGLSKRAEQRDDLPILGPQGGLPATARFLTVAREMADALPATGWSQEVADAAQSPASGGEPDFISTLSSLASFRDPAAIAAGEGGGSPFPDWGATGTPTGVFAGAGGAAASAEGSRPRPGPGVSRSSIVARLAARAGSEGPATVSRGARGGVPDSQKSSPPAPRLAEPPHRTAAPIRRGTVTEQPTDAPGVAVVPASLVAPGHVQRVTEFPALDVAIPSPEPAIAHGPLAATPFLVEDAPRGAAGPQGSAAQVARLAEEPALGSEPRPPDDATLREATRSLPLVAAPVPNVTAEMPLATFETDPGTRGEPAVGDATRTDAPSVSRTVSRLVTSPEMPFLRAEAPSEPRREPVVGDAPGAEARNTGAGVARLTSPAEMPLVTPDTRRGPFAGDTVSTDAADVAERVSSVLTPAEMGVQSVSTGQPPDLQRSSDEDSVMTSTSITRESPVAEAVARPQPSTTLHRLTVGEIGKAIERATPGSAGGIPPVSPTVSGAGTVASRTVEYLNEPLLLTEPWAAGAPGDSGQQRADVGSLDLASPGTGEPSASSTPAQTPRTQPISAVSRSIEPSGEQAQAMPPTSPRESGWEGSAVAGSAGAWEQRREFGDEPSNLSEPGGYPSTVLRAFQPASESGDIDEAGPGRGATERTADADALNEPTVRSIDATPQGWTGRFALPELELASQTMALVGRGALAGTARQSARGDRGSTTFPVSRFADLPLAPAPGLLREADTAPAAATTAAPPGGATGAAVPASPPAAAAAEGDVDKLADRVWQVLRRRLEVERERQRGLP